MRIWSLLVACVCAGAVLVGQRVPLAPGVPIISSGAPLSLDCPPPTCSFQTSFLPSENWNADYLGVNVNNKQVGVGGASDLGASPGNVPDSVKTIWNNPRGRGGRGFGHAVGNTNTGVGVSNGGGFNIPTGAVGEFWVQWSFLFPAGWAWTRALEWGNPGPQPYPFNLKMAYIGDTSRVLGFSGDPFAFILNTDPRFPLKAGMGAGTVATKSWQSIMGGGVGDGLPHCVEGHFKTDTNGANGIVELWVDRDKLVSLFDVRYNGVPFNGMHMGSNMRYVNNVNPPQHMQLDDLYVSPSQRINLCP